MNFSEEFGMHTESQPEPQAITVAGKVRITVLTERLIRVETGCVTDEATQTVLCRRFPVPAFRVRQEDETILVSTPQTALCLDAETGKMRYLKTRDCGKITKLGKNLKGTYRTLDMASGRVKLKDGILSKSGAAVLDDSRSLLLNPDGTVSERKDCCDRYYFAYGRDYEAALKDFYRLTGPVPLLPRYCLGNWWSRYWAYTQEEYLSLMDKFKQEKIPLTVATVDMDWHWVKVVEKFGEDASNRKNKKTPREKQHYSTPGWTGYTWNTDLFPDYKAFLRQLHDDGLKVTLNLHPAAGVRFYEQQYEEMANAMGIDPATKQHVPFDITDPKFISAYFSILHHGYERDGVDFWWIDWQQGDKTNIPGLDPLWALNHYHYLDSCRDGKRGLTLSRYAGPGSHRYPLGFSGDTIMNWDSLKFQPEFTATASNIGYTWWSHDIGGHHMGIHDDELFLRWLQLGVFSPINRLHSTSDPFMGKEPWNYRTETEGTAKRFLRLRRRLIPYLYTENYRTHTEGTALVRPMYYEHPWDEDAYRVPDQYRFGDGLTVAPICEPRCKKTGLAGTDVYLDGKTYTDIFTGDRYSYRGIHRMYRDIDSFPVLAREGTILPLDMDAISNGADNPADLELLIFSGYGSYTLYEDDGETLSYQSGQWTKRQFTVQMTDEGGIFTIEPAGGAAELAPQKRHFRLSFRNVQKDCEYTVTGCEKTAVCADCAFLMLDLYDIAPGDRITVTLSRCRVYIPRSRKEKRTALFSRLQGKNIPKTMRYSAAYNSEHPADKLTGQLRLAAEEIDLQEEKK